MEYLPSDPSQYDMLINFQFELAILKSMFNTTQFYQTNFKIALIVSYSHNLKSKNLKAFVFQFFSTFYYCVFLSGKTLYFCKN